MIALGPARETLGDRLVHELVRRIFVGDYAPGVRLAPERTLAVELDTDRTSLRMALSQLKRMNLLTVVQGSGSVVNDFREHAGIEFFLHAFSLDDTPVEPALLCQVLEYFYLTLPGVFALAAKRASDAELQAIEDLYRRQVEVAADPAAAAECAVAAIDAAADASGNLLFQMILRSTRPVRFRLLRRVFALVDGVERARANLEWVRTLRSRTLSPDQVEARYRSMLARPFDTAREQLFRSGFAPSYASRLIGSQSRDADQGASAARRSVETTSDRLALELMRRIYVGQYTPGQRLTPERELAVELATDRTSLRVALGQIRRMNLISAVQGSGMIVKDFRREAGIDFFEHVFALEDTPLEGEVLAQLVDYMNVTVPPLVGHVARVATPEAMEKLERLYREGLTVADQVDAVAEVLTRGEDMFASASGNVVIELVYRSTRPLRLRLARHVARHHDMSRRLRADLELIDAVKRGLVPADAVEGLFAAFQTSLDRDAREALIAAGRATNDVSR